MDFIDILKEFTRTFMAGFVMWIGVMLATLIFIGLEIPFLVQFKKKSAINPIPLILTALVGGIIAWIAEASIFYVILSLAGGAYLGYQADRYAARNIGKKVSWISNRDFMKNIMRHSTRPSTSYRPSSSSRSAPSSTNSSNFGGGTSSGGGGSSKW